MSARLCYLTLGNTGNTDIGDDGMRLADKATSTYPVKLGRFVANERRKMVIEDSRWTDDYKAWLDRQVAKGNCDV